MAEEYRWQLQIQSGAQTNTNARVATNQFGSGYEQVQEDGINSAMRTVELEHIGQINDKVNNPKDVEAFLRRHYVKAFIFTPAHGEKGLFRVKADSVKYSPKGRLVGIVTCTLTEAVGVLA